MASFPDVLPTAAGEPVREEDIDNDLSRLRRSIGRGHKARATSVRSRPAGSRWPALALAAGLALTLVGLALWSVHQASTIRAQGRELARIEDELNRGAGRDHSFEIVSLTPVGAGSRRALETEVPSIAADDDAALPVVLNHYAPDQALYEAELVSSAGDVLRTWKSLRPTSSKNFTIRLPPSLREPGDYQIRLYRITDAGGRTAEARFLYRVGG